MNSDQTHNIRQTSHTLNIRVEVEEDCGTLIWFNFTDKNQTRTLCRCVGKDQACCFLLGVLAGRMKDVEAQ